MLALLNAQGIGMAGQLVDSALATTREYWRTRYFAASPEEAADPRPFIEVLKDRLKGEAA